MNSRQTPSYQLGLFIKPIAAVLLVGAIFISLLIAVTLGQSLTGMTFVQKLQSIFGMVHHACRRIDRLLLVMAFHDLGTCHSK
jgi:hypothetical protein